MSTRDKNLLIYGFIALVTCIAYACVFANGFLLDDESLILQNTYIRGWEHVGDIFTSSLMRGANIACSFYRPLQSILYLVIYQADGLSPFGYHLVNIVLHTANACLVYSLGRRLSFTQGVSLAAALIWAIHPIQTEAVAYMSATADPLHTFFCLSGVIVLLPDFTPRKFMLATGLFILALLSKETAIVFPLLVMSCLFLLSPKRLRITTYFCTWPLWGVAALYSVLHLSIPAFAGFDIYRQADPAYAQHVLCRIYTFLATLPAYLQLLLWPSVLHPERNFPIYETPWHLQVVAGFVLIMTAVTCIAMTRKQNRPAVAWGLIWFFTADLLHMGIIMPINGIFMEHWMYLPTIGFFLGLAETGAQYLSAQKWRLISTAALATIIVAFGIKTEYQTLTWRDPERFYTHIFASDDYLPEAHNGLGNFYLHRGEYVKALDQFDRAIQQSKDTLADSQYDYGVALLKSSNAQSDMRGALPHLIRALDLNPDLFQAAHVLSITYAALGDNGQADFYQKKSDAIAQKLKAMFGSSG